MTGTEIDHGGGRRIVLVAASVVVALVGVSIPVAVALVSRTSSASFADQEILANNRLGAAVLELDLDIMAGPADDPTPPVDPVAGTVNALFMATNLAPGDRVTGYLRLTNQGGVPVRHGLQAVASNGVLRDWLRFDAGPGSGTCGPGEEGPRLVDDIALDGATVELVPVATASATNGAGTGAGNVIGPGESVVWCLGATLVLETPNSAQNESLGVTFVIPFQQDTGASAGAAVDSLTDGDGAAGGDAGLDGEATP